MKILFAALVMVLPLISGARAPEPAPDKTLSPYFFIPGGDPAVDKLPLESTRADVQISGVIARVKVT